MLYLDKPEFKRISDEEVDRLVAALEKLVLVTPELAVGSSSFPSEIPKLFESQEGPLRVKMAVDTVAGAPAFQSLLDMFYSFVAAQQGGSFSVTGLCLHHYIVGYLVGSGYQPAVGQMESARALLEEFKKVHGRRRQEKEKDSSYLVLPSSGKKVVN